MRLKTFHANTMTEAMQMIRDTLGEEAIIVATGENPGHKGVRVTAAVEPPAFEIGDDGIAGPSNWLQYDDEQDSDAVAEELTEIMLRHCVPEDVMDNIISCATVVGFDDVSTALVSILEQLYSFRPLPITAQNKPILMVGPPGSGKTLAAAKLATRGTMNGLDVGVISTDTVRAGGVEQLEAFTKLLKVPLQKAHDNKDLRNIAESMSKEKDQVIIDSSGLNPFDKDDVKLLAKLINACNCQPVLVMPAGIDADEAGEMARVFAAIGTRDILPTRVDIARRLGNLLAAAHQGGLCFTDVSATPKVAQGLEPLSPHTLARLLTPRLYQNPESGMIHASHHHNDGRKTGTRS